MENRLRYSGCWPPLEILADYPNWVFALDEESEEGQDETTIKPETQQSWISEETSFTVADVTLADGRNKIGILRLEGSVPSALDVFDEGDWWCVQQGLRKKWEPVNETWLPEEERRPSVSLDNKSIFPLIAKARLPRADGKNLILSLRADGLPEPNWS